MIFSLVILEKNNCLITFNIHCFIRLNITLLHFATALLLQQRKYPESHVIQSIRYGKSPDKKVSRSQAVMPDLMIWKQILLSHDTDVI